MSLLKMLAQIEQVSAALEKLQGRGRPSWIVPTAAIAVCGLTVWQAPNLTQAYVSLDSAVRVNANTATAVDDSPLGLQMAPSAYSFRVGTPSEWAASSGSYDTYNPYPDTVHFTDFSYAFGTALSGGSDFSSTTPIGVNNWNGTVQGGRVTSYGGTGDRMLDSVVATGMASPPWVWESRVESGTKSGADLHLNFTNGNGSGAASSLTKFYIRMSFIFEGSTLCPSCVDYEPNGGGDKLMRIKTNGPGQSDSPLLDLLWNGLAMYNVGSTSAHGCEINYSNAWNLYQPGDTAGAPGYSGWSFDSNCPARGWIDIEPGVPMHIWVCYDLGAGVVSWGLITPTQSGIAGWYDDLAIPSSETGFYIDTTWGGSGNAPFSMTRFVDELLVTTTSGSETCIDPFT